MDAQRWQAIQSTFDTIVEMDDVQRANQLTALSSSDPELRAAVELLLAADSDADARLASLDAVFFPQPVPLSDPLGLAGQSISHFEVYETIGTGGMGVVYRAKDTRLNRAVALKFLLPSHSPDAGAKARFLREAHLIAALDHPNLCTIYDVGTSADGRLFLAMALYPGETLKARMTREGPMPASDVLEITRQIAKGLQCAHEAGIAHRDLKPGNVMLLPDGTVKILDFGLAKAWDQSLSDPGALFGTVSYMSPEQIRGDPADGRSDLWALGVVMYEMLTARRPFSGEREIAFAHAILHDEPTPLPGNSHGVTAVLENAALRLLEKDPKNRYATAAELISDLARTDVTAQTTRRRRVPSSRRRVGIAIGVTLAATAAVLALLPRKPEPLPAPDRVQVTFTGNAMAASLSPDGTRLAFGEKQCNEASYCTYQVVIQDTDGRNRLVVSRNATHVFRTAWTADARYLVYDATYGGDRWGVFVISTLGGVPRHLGGGRYDLLGGDTILMAAGLLHGDSVGWVRRITAHDGQTLDSIPVRSPGTETPGYGFDITRTGYPDRFIVTVRKTFESAPELRLIDSRGATINRVTPGFATFGRLIWSRWVPSRQKLVVAYERALSSGELDIVSMDVTASGIVPHIDTVFSGLETSDGMFDISPDGERLVHSPGSVETTVSAIDTRRTKDGRFVSAQVLSSTTLLRGLISPAGDRIVVVREIPTVDGHSSYFSILPRDGGAESQMAGGVRDLLDFKWSHDGSRIMYLHGIGARQVRLMESDTTGRGTREIARLDQSDAIAFHPLPDGAICIIPPERRSVSIIHRPGKKDVAWPAPDWISFIAGVSLSPDKKLLAIQAWDGAGDSVVVATVNIENGRFTRLGVFGGEWVGGIKWLNDGNIMFDFREPRGAYALFMTRPGGAVRRLGAFPYTQEMSSVSNDGIHMAGFNFTTRKDVYMIRNFGKMLKR